MSDAFEVVEYVKNLEGFKSIDFELIKNNMFEALAAGDEPFVALIDNKPAFFVVKKKVFIALLEALEDADTAIDLLKSGRI